jgi:hypothetical protein
LRLQNRRVLPPNAVFFAETAAEATGAATGTAFAAATTGFTFASLGRKGSRVRIAGVGTGLPAMETLPEGFTGGTVGATAPVRRLAPPTAGPEAVLAVLGLRDEAVAAVEGRMVRGLATLDALGGSGFPATSGTAFTAAGGVAVTGSGAAAAGVVGVAALDALFRPDFGAGD